MLSFASHWQLLKVDWFEVSFVLFNIYGSTSPTDKTDLWDSLSKLFL